MILLKMLSSIPSSRARKFCRTALRKSCSFKFGYIALPQTVQYRSSCIGENPQPRRRKWRTRRNVASAFAGTITISVVILPCDIGGIEHDPEQFLWVERSGGLLQSFPLPMMRSDNHDNAVACCAD